MFIAKKATRYLPVPLGTQPALEIAYLKARGRNQVAFFGYRTGDPETSVRYAAINLIVRVKLVN